MLQQSFPGAAVGVVTRCAREAGAGGREASAQVRPLPPALALALLGDLCCSRRCLVGWCRRYKELAILVHPDKSKAAGAEEAFKRLSVAYECLSDESSQRSYLRTLLATRSLHQTPKRPRPPPPGAVSPSYPRKKKTKKSDQQPPPPPRPPPREASSAPSVPRHQRTPEEIWKQFQEEEERLAREEFLSKGFERTYASSDSRPNAEADYEKPSVDAAVQESILNSDLHEKAQNWTTWKKNTASSPSSSTPRTISRNDEDTSAKRDPVVTEPELICCLLCQRKFPTHEALSRHKLLSKLHLANLQRAQSN